MRVLVRLVLSFALSPLVAAFLLGCLSLIADGRPVWRTHSMFLQDTIQFSYLTVVLFGLPLALLFSLMRLKRWWHYAATGFVLGTGIMIFSYQLIPVSDMPAALTGGGDYYQPINWLRSLGIGSIAFMTALTFWWLRHGNFERISVRHFRQ